MNDPLFPLLLTLRYMHILGAIALMGGTIFARFALLPTLAGLSSEERRALHEQVRGRWSKVVMASAALLLISGVTNLALASRYDHEGPFSYNMLAGIKLILALPIFYIASVLAGRSALAQKFREQASFWLTVNLILALSMVALGGVLRFVPRTLKAAPPPAMSLLLPAERNS